MVKTVVREVPPVYLCCDTLITAEDVASASRFQNEARRREHLAWRRVVREELGRGVRISYNEVGAPMVDTPNTWISVAHSQGVVAVAISNRKVGIDIESSERDFERAKGRFMSQEEMTLSSHKHWAAYVWCAKEALYKLYGKRGVELRDELRIESHDEVTRQMQASLAGDKRRAVVEIQLHEGDMIVAVATFDE